MKNIIYILALAFLSACGVQGKDKNNASKQTSDMPIVETQENILPDLQRDETLHKITTFLPEELQQRIDKSEPGSVRDFFLLIPDTCLFFGGELKQRKEMLQGKPESYAGVRVERCDEDNNYLALTEYEGKWEMFARQLSPVRWQIMINAQGCGEFCGTIKNLCYYYENGTLYQSENTLLRKYQDYGLEQFLNRSGFSDNEWLAMQKEFDQAGNDKILFDLPQDAKTLNIYIDQMFFQHITEVKPTAFKIIHKNITQQ